MAISVNHDIVNTVNLRRTAAQILQRWLQQGAFPDRLLSESDLPDHRAFLMEVVYGVVKWKREMEWVIRQYASRKPEVPVLVHVLVGIYQLLHMDSVADYAAVNETVMALKSEGVAMRKVRFANALLRRVAAGRESLVPIISEQALGVRASHPDILLARWRRCWREDQVEALCNWNNLRAETVVRINPGRMTMAAFIRTLAERGIGATPHPFAPEACAVLARGCAVADLPGYGDGGVTVQDPATLRAVTLLDPHPGETVLDACAAPGGKTILIAEQMRGIGTLVAMDRQEERLERLRANLQRMAWSSVRTVVGDITAMDDRHLLCRAEDRFDRILLDVPCTNTGVLRRRPDARWRFGLAGLEELRKVQAQMLCCAAKFLKPRGIIVYSTCSLEPEEGPELVRTWIGDHPHFRITGEESLFPPESRTDGMYAVRLESNLPREGKDPSESDQGVVLECG